MAAMKKTDIPDKLDKGLAALFLADGYDAGQRRSPSVLQQEIQNVST